jgi:hypothetical protein
VGGILKYISAVRLGLAIPALISLAACDQSRAESSVDAYISFSKAVQRGDSKAAYATLSQETQKKLAAKAKEVSAASGGAIKDDPPALVFSGAPRSDSLTEVKLLRQSGDRAVLAVSGGGRSYEVEMVREHNGWKVDLTDKMNDRDGAPKKP